MAGTRTALTIAAALSGVVLALPASAQPGGRLATASTSGSGLNLSAGERAALLPVKQAVDAGNWAAAAAAMPAARAAVQGIDARYVAARLDVDIATATGNRTALTQAIASVLETRRAPVDEQVELLREYAALIYDAGSAGAAEQTLNRVLQLAPNDVESLSMLGQINRNRGNNVQALAYFQRAFRAAEATGTRLPESRYRVALALAEQAQQRPAAVELARQLVLNYPTANNWRDAVTVFRTVGTVDASQNVDAVRLMRASGGLGGERDYLTAAQAADQGGSGAEAKAILEEGATRGMLSASDATSRAQLTAATQRATRERSALAGQITQARAATATAAQARAAADGLFGQGRYAEAAELYRVALTRTGEDPNLLNTRLGASLALAGQKPEAEAALRSVTGSRAELAGLWLAWLARRTS